MDRDGLKFALAGAFLVALSGIPTAFGYLIEPADRSFMGIVSDVPDWVQYRAWMTAFGKAVVIENPLTCEPHSAAFFNPQWLLLGRLAARLPAAVVLHTFQLLAAALFLYVTYRICCDFFSDLAARWTAWLLINASAGFGWVWVLEKRLSGRADALFPLDIYVAEPISFQNMIIFPHFLVAAILLVLTFRTAAAAVDRRRHRWAACSGLLALALGLTHGYDLVIVYAVLGAFSLLLLARRQHGALPLTVAAAIMLLSAPPALYFAHLTATHPIWRSVLAQFNDAGVHTPSPPHLLILLGLPLVLTLATWRNVMRWPEGGSWPLLVRVWCVVNFFLLYLPVGFQIHMLNGCQIPLGLLAAEGVLNHIVPWLHRRRLLPQRVQLGNRALDGRTFLIVLLVLLAVPTNLYLFGWRIKEVLRLEHDHFLYLDELAALEWLDQHSTDTETVLASLTVGEYIPALTGNRVFAAHWAQTVDFERKRAQLAAFFRPATTESERLATLDRCDVRYVLEGRAERALGAFEPERAAYLAKVFEAGETRLYRVLPHPVAGTPP